jgi:CDP-glucose 4,6-dehydratase
MEGLVVMGVISDLENFYKNKKVFVTGHTGFKGSWLVLWLKKLGADVTAYSLPPEGESLFELAGIENEIKSVFGDIRNYNDLFVALKKSEAEIVIHMAAQAFVLESYRDPIKTYETNVAGTINLFEAIRKVSSVKAVLNVTTDKCYENQELNLPFKEDDKLGGHDPYSSSKACSEIITSCWRDSFFAQSGVMLASARAGNVIGGGDFSQDRVIPDIIRAIKKNEKVILRSPKSIRPWQHVLEPLLGYLMLVMSLFNEKEKFTSAYNFGPDKESKITVEDITKTFINKIGFGSYDVKKDEQFYEAKTLRLDNGKAKEQLGWKPIFDFDQAIDFTAIWYANYLNKKISIKDFTLQQISLFCKKF